MFCEECGKQIPDNSKFCDGCGAPVKQIGSTAAPYEQPSRQAGPSYEKPQAFGGYIDQTRPAHEPYRNPGYGQPQKDRGYVPRDLYERGMEREREKKKGGAQTALIVILSVVAVALIAVLVVLGIRTFGGKKDGGGESPAAVNESEETWENLFVKEDEATQATPETTIPETKPVETEATATAPTVPETTIPASTEAVAEYILPTSNSAYLTEADLAPLTKEQLRLARNEIYARHGRKFKDASLNDYFLSKSWYVPTIEPDRFNENVFNDYETANRKLIADYEKKMGY